MTPILVTGALLVGLAVGVVLGLLYHAWLDDHDAWSTEPMPSGYERPALYVLPRPTAHALYDWQGDPALGATRTSPEGR